MIQELTTSYVLVLARVATFIALLPLFNGRVIPRLVKLSLSIALATVWYSSVTDPVVATARGATAEWLWFGVALGRECVIGSVFGYVFGLFLLPAKVAGEFIGQEMGLALGAVSDPAAESSSTLLGQIFEVLATLAFLGLDGHHLWFASLHMTFERWPIGELWLSPPIGPLVDGANQAHEWGLVLAAPVAACLFVTSIILSLLARAAPQMNIVSIGFALRLVVGLVAMLIFFPDIVVTFGHVFGRFTKLVQLLL